MALLGVPCRRGCWPVSFSSAHTWKIDTTDNKGAIMITTDIKSLVDIEFQLHWKNRTERIPIVSLPNESVFGGIFFRKGCLKDS